METQTMLMQTVSSGESVDLSVGDESFDYDHDDDGDRYSDNQKSAMMNSPTDVRSYRHRSHDDIPVMEDHEHQQYYEREDSFNNSLSMLGDPLPIVREGSILDSDGNEVTNDNDDNSGGAINDDGDDDGDDDDDDVEVTEEFLEYQREQDGFRREMNTTKIAFSSFRGAVLHLVHNQESFTRKSSSTASTAASTKDGSEVEDASESEVGSVNQDDNDDNTINTVDEANERMTRLEEMAREIVETKAKACFEAVDVVKQFDEMREEKRQRRRMLLGGLAGVGGEDTMLAELRKMKRRKADSRSSSTSSTDSSSSMDTTEEVKVASKENNSTAKKPEPTKKENLPKANNQNSRSHPRTKKQSSSSPFGPPVVGPIVRLKKKPARHPDCIKATLPKFTLPFSQEQEDEDQDNNEFESFTPAKYRTSKWIANMAKWRIEKRKHNEAALTKCGCPDCLVDLKYIYDNDKKK